MNEPADVHGDLTTRLVRVDLLLLRAVHRQRARPSSHQKGEFWGQYISDDEVDELLAASGEIDRPVGVDLGALDDAIARSEALRDQPAPQSRLQHLREAFGLDGDDVDLLLLALAPEVAAGYGKIFAYLNDDLNRHFLTVDLATRALRTRRRARLALQERLLPGGPLVKQRLVRLTPAPGEGPQSGRRISLPPRLLEWLLGDAPVPLREGITRVPIEGTPFIPEACHARIASLSSQLRPDSRGMLPRWPVTITVLGSTTGMREAVAMAVAEAAGQTHLLRIDVERCTAALDDPWELVRDLRLSQELPWLVELPDLGDDPDVRTRTLRFGTALASLPYPVCVGGKDRHAVARMIGQDRARVALPVGRVTVVERSGAWRRALGAAGWDHLDAESLATRFAAIGGTAIDRVVAHVAAEVLDKPPTEDHVLFACREATRPEFSGLAQHVVPRYAWDDLILPPKTLAQLQQLEKVLTHQETVMFHWGRQKIRPRGYGIKALFSGAPGTGKTMCAEVIAGSLGYDLYKVDLSSVVSKWVGETEKNLRKIFDAAEGGTSVLLFDEGDALFGSRGESNNAQDKYANQEVSYLLQRLETFEGCAIVTTNLQENIDEAFLRRFGAVVEFPFPSPRERARLWRKALPDAEMCSDDLDPDILGKQFVLAGGSIVNAAIVACIEAAADGGKLTMRHCVVAVARELHKMGKQINSVHFGEFHAQVRDLF